MEIPKNLKDEIWEYCRLNDISNIDEFIVKMIRQGYTSEKFGATPVGYGSVKEVEKVVEVIKEVPVEKLVEVIREVPVEKIVTKIEYVSDKSGETELIEKLNTLEEENKKFSTKLSESEEEIRKFSTITTEMENIFQKETSLRDKEIEKLKKELEEEKKKIKNETDIYGDEKRGGWFGSNILKR
jgi:phenylalanyl-tRNA synthetase alpha subunit